MKKITSILLIILSIVLLCSCGLPLQNGGGSQPIVDRTPVYYEESTDPPKYSDTSDSSGVLEFRLHENGSEYAVWGVNHEVDPLPEEIVIPSTFNGKPVTRINEDAFSICYAFTKVTISEGVVSIGTKAFWACGNLEEIVIPSTVTLIGESAFEECHKLKSVKLPDGLQTIENKTFSECEALAKAELPNNLKVIGQKVFSGCKALTKIDLPSGLETIGTAAFSDTGLREIEIPGSVTCIPNSCFHGCKDLKRAVIPATVTVIAPHAFGYVSEDIDVEFRGTKAQFEAIDPGQGYNNWIYGDRYDGPFTVRCTDGTLEYRFSMYY